MKNLYLYFAIMFISTNLSAQKLNKTDVLQDDVYLYPPHMDPNTLEESLDKKFNRLRLRLTDVRSILKGDFNGDGFEELALIGEHNSNWNYNLERDLYSLQISTLESRAYEIVNSRNDYGNPVLVNTQEGYSGMRMLDHPSNSTRNGSNTI